MSGLCGASALVFAWIFLGVVRTAEALTPLDPCKSLLKEKKKKKSFSCCALFCPATVKSGGSHMTAAKWIFTNHMNKDNHLNSW